MTILELIYLISKILVTFPLAVGITGGFVGVTYGRTKIKQFLINIATTIYIVCIILMWSNF